MSRTLKVNESENKKSLAQYNTYACQMLSPSKSAISRCMRLIDEQDGVLGGTCSY